MISPDEAERQVLAAALLSESGLASVTENLDTKHFERPFHRRIMAAIKKLDARAVAVDVVTVADELNRSDDGLTPEEYAVLATLGNEYLSVADHRRNAEVVLQNAIDRRIARIGHAIAEIGLDKHPPTERDQQIDNLIGQIYETQAVNEADPLEDALEVMLERTRRAAAGEVFGLSTGYQDLDELLAGMQPGQMLVVAARPGMGKSALITNIAHNVAIGHTPVAIFSLEMSTAELAMRLVSRASSVPLSRMRRHAEDLDEADWTQMQAAAAQLSALPLYVDDRPPYTSTSIRARARRAVRTRGVGLVVVDYLQLLEAPGENRQVQVAEISRSLKLMARELEVPVLVAAQLSRANEARQDKRPVLSDLRDSGAIEQDADVVIFPYRPDYYEPGESDTAEIIVAKQRNGAIGTVRLQWLAATIEFAERRRRAEGMPPNIEPDDIPFS